MVQPEELKSEEFLPWSRARGVDVWAMLWAATTGDLETIRQLSAREPNLVHCEYQYLTPLRFAVRENQRAVVEFLLEQSANASIEIGDSLTQIARDRGYLELVTFLESWLRQKYGIAAEGELAAAAIREFDTAKTRSLLSAQPHLLNVADARGNRPLHWAVMTRQLELIDHLLQLGADINGRRPDGARPIDLTNGDYHYRGWRDLPPTALQKHEVVIGHLLARGAECDLSMAAKLGDLKRIRELVGQDPALVNRQPPHSSYYSGLPLRCAAAAGNLEAVKLLLDCGANPNEPEPGIAPEGGALHAAIRGKHYPIVKLLLERGANPNANVESSGNCLSMAKWAGAPKEIVDLIASYGGALTVELVCHDGDVQTLANMLRVNPNLDFSNAFGGAVGSRPILDLILRYQPNILKSPVVYDTAWWDLGIPEGAEHARWLMQHGLEPGRGNWLGASLLHRCAAKGNVEVAAVCLEFGADINATDTDACSTPLGWAARAGQLEMVEWLLAKGADPALPREKPWAQPSAWAERRGHREIVDRLKVFLSGFASIGYYLSSNLSWIWLAPALSLLLTALSAPAAPSKTHGHVELLRDHWGIPHVFSDTDAGAMYGLGYATAEQRGFQMTYNVRIIQGRLAEVLGERPRGNRKETTVDHDRRMRTMGWSRAAARTAANLDSKTRTLLQAYCDGVNDSFAAQKSDGKLHPLFSSLNVTCEPWTPADCLLSWWHLAQFFATDGTRDLLVWHNRLNPRPGQPQPPLKIPAWHDDSTSVVQREDVSAGWLRRVEAFRRATGLGENEPGATAPKFSHAWVVGGKRTTTGSAVLVSDPQTPVRNPSLWMEFHISGKTFNCRGIGVPGSPGLLVGFNQEIAWGLTALGADQADLFRLETDATHPDQYRWDGKWRKFLVRTERIQVKGAAEVELKVRETHLGPVMSEFCFRQSGDPEVALKRIPLCDEDRDTIQACFAIMRAKTAAQFVKAGEDWRFPSANCVYGDAAGHIGYTTLGAVPLRPPSAPEPNGNEALPGTGDQDDWRGFVPQDLLPQVRDPRAGLLLSANHRPVGSFYRIPLGISTGSMGDTIRSWRLREKLIAKEKFTPRDVLEVHYDTVNPARREIVRLALHLRNTGQASLSPDALAALEVLEKWFAAGASSDLKLAGASLATRISTFFRFIATPLATRYGGGESGLSRFLKDTARRIAADPQAKFDDEEQRFIDQVLAAAWREEQAAGREAGRDAAGQNKLGWFDSLDGFGSLDAQQDLVRPGITCLDGQTIQSQAGQSYTQWVSLEDVDSAMTICPIGHDDRPDSPWRTSTMSLWGEGKLHAAPLSRKAVEKIATQRLVLSTKKSRN